MALLVIEPIPLPQKTIAATSYTVTIADYSLTLVNDDYIVVGVVVYENTATLSTTSSGWSEISELGVTSGQRMALYQAKVASGTVADLVINAAASTMWQAGLMQWRDANTTTFNLTAVTKEANATSITMDSSTPSEADCTILYFGSLRSGNTAPAVRFLPDKVVGRLIQDATDDVNNKRTAMCFGTVQQAAAADIAQTMYCDQSSATRLGIIAIPIKNKASGGKERDSRAGITKVNWLGSFGSAHDGISAWNALSGMVTWTGGLIAGVTVHTSGITPTTIAIGPPFWGPASNFSSALNADGFAAGGAWVGSCWDVTSVDLSNKIVTVEWMIATLGQQIGDKGAIICFADASGNAAVYQVSTKSMMQGGVIKTAHIAVGTATTIHTEGTGNPFSAVTKIGVAYHRTSTSTTARSINFRNIQYHTTTKMVGGNATVPLNVKFAAIALNGWGFAGLCDIQGDAVMVKTPIQFGDGTVATYVDTTSTMLNTPTPYNVAKQPHFNVPANTLTIGVKAASGDTMNFKASSMIAGAGLEQNFTVDPATSAGATYSFQGEVIGNFLFAGDTDVPIVGATYSGCDEVAFGGADVTSTTITNTTSTDAACSFDANGAVVTSCTISGSGALYAIELGTAVTAITLADCTITAGSTDKVHVKATTGTVTITISGTTALAAGDVTTDGATVVIAAPELYQEVTVTGLAATYRLQIFDIEYVLTVSGITVTPAAGATYTHNGITWTVRSASITAGAGTITVYGTGAPATSGTLTKTGGTGDASVAFSAYAVDGTELYIGVPGATSYTWTDSVAAAAPRVIRVRVMEDGPGTSDAIEMIDAIVGMCGITEGTESVGYLVAAVADDVYNDRGVDGSAITGITIDDTTLRLEIASGAITNYNGTDVLVVDGRDLYAYETYWLGTTAGMRDEARFIEAIDAVNFRCSNFKLKGTSGYPIMINNCFIVDAATGIFSSMVDYSGDPISNHPEHMKAIVVTTSDSVVTGTLAEFIAAVPTANDIAQEVVTGITF